MMRRNLSILGSTGSIGRQTLEVVAARGSLDKVLAMTFHRNVKLAEEQARQFRPRLMATPDEQAAADLRVRLADTGVKVVGGEEGLIQAATFPLVDMAVAAIVGIAGLKPTLAAIDAGGRNIALANKEVLVCAGDLVMERAKEKGCWIIPVDSEHSAIFQCLKGEVTDYENRRMDTSYVQKLILTASGGPFFGMDREALAHVTKEDTLKHPNWAMGAKVTIDSATLMNKGLEVIEAMRLFGIPVDRIQVVIHRESIIHSMVEFIDGSVLAQMGSADMRLPIQYAMSWPGRICGPANKLDLLSCPSMTFREPDMESFRCLALALGCAQQGNSSATAILNGANEAAVGLFLESRISFLDIPRLVEDTLGRIPAVFRPTLEQIFEADRAAREAVYEAVR